MMRLRSRTTIREPSTGEVAGGPAEGRYVVRQVHASERPRLHVYGATMAEPVSARPELYRNESYRNRASWKRGADMMPACCAPPAAAPLCQTRGMDLAKCDICKKTAICNGTVCIDCREKVVLAPAVAGAQWTRTCSSPRRRAPPCILTRVHAYAPVSIFASQKRRRVMDRHRMGWIHASAAIMAVVAARAVGRAGMTWRTRWQKSGPCELAR